LTPRVVIRTSKYSPEKSKLFTVFTVFIQEPGIFYRGAKDALTQWYSWQCALETIMEHPHGIMILGTFWLICLFVAAVGWGAWTLLS
jgi:hypothetical protein